jgi:hypothetical protein
MKQHQDEGENIVRQKVEQVIFGSVEAAKREAGRCITESEKWTARLSSAQAELRALETGINILDAPDPENEIRTRGSKIAAARSQVEIIEHAAEAAARRVAEANLAVRRAEASDFRADAAKKRAELARLSDEARPLLARLSALMEIEFDLSLLAGQRIGDWLNIVGARPSQLCNAFELVPNQPAQFSFAVPLTRKLYDEAAALDRRAEAIEAELERAAEQSSLAAQGVSAQTLERMSI